MSRNFTESVKLSQKFLDDPVAGAMEYLTQESSKNSPIHGNRGFRMALKHCRDLEKTGSHWLGYAQAVEDELGKRDSDFSGEFLETLETMMSSPAPLTVQDGFVEWVRNTYVGLIEFDQSSSSVLVTSKGAAEGLDDSTLWSEIWLRAMSEVPNADNRTLTHYDAKNLIRVATQRYLKSQGPKDELKKAHKKKIAVLPPTAALHGEPIPTRLYHLPSGEPITRPRIDRASEGAWLKIKTLMEPLWDAYSVKGEREREGFFRFIVGIATLTMEPGSICQWALFLSGSQGCGKTSFGVELALRTAPAQALNKGSTDPKKVIENFARASVGYIDEIDTWGRLNENLKDLLSSTSLTARKSYAGQATTVKRSWMWLATANVHTLPDDGAGLRRYFPIRLSGGVDDGATRARFLEGYRETLWAIGYQCYLVGYPIDLDPEIMRENFYTGFKEESDVKDLMRQFLPAIAQCVTQGSDRFDRLNITAMLEVIGQKFTSRNSKDVSDVLEENGWESRTIRDSEGKSYSRTWVPPGAGSQFGVISVPHPDALAVIRRALSKT